MSGGAAGEFLRDHPGGFQPGARPRPGDLTTNRPGRPGAGGDDLRPGGRPSRPGQDGGGIQRPGTRPGQDGGGIQRPGTRPGQDGGGTQRPTRPGQDGGGIQRPDRPGRPGEDGSGIRPDRPGRPGEDGGGIRPDRPGRPGDDDGKRPGRPGDDGRFPDRRPGTRPGQGGAGERWNRDDWRNWARDNRPNRIPDRDQWRDWRNNRRDDVWDHWHNHWHDHNHWYDRDWWSRHNINWWYAPNFNYWGWAAWPGLAGWVDYGWSQPVYYNYGDNVYYQDDQVYYGDQVVASAADYAQQAEAIATNLPAEQPAPEDWMPLGVFAVTTDGQPSDTDPTMYLQLAVSKQGVISGTFQNTADDTVTEVEGMVDKQTQRAAWTAKGKTRPLMETGIVNLTQDTTPALVHFADGTTQQWLLVRLDKPSDSGTPSTQ